MSTSSERRGRRPRSAVSIASRVVPGDLGDDHALAARGSALTSEDLPTFGRPMTARRTRSSSSSGSSSLGQQLDERGRAGRRCRAPARPTPPSARRGRGRGTRRRAGCPRRVDLVRGHDDRQARRGAAGRRSPRRRAAGRRLRVDDEHRDLARRRARRAPGRGSRRRAGRCPSRSTPPVSISVKRAAVPLGRELLAVARDPRALVHDRLARLRQAVDERGLADVRVADDRDLHHVRAPWPRPRAPTIRSTTSSSVRPVVSTATASGAGASGPCSRRGRARRASSARAARRRRRRRARPRGAARAPRVGGEEDLDLGVGRDDRADVAALGHPVAVGEERALLRDERLAHGRVGRHARGGLARPRGVRIALGDVLAVEQHAVAELERATLRRSPPGRRRRAARQRDGAVHRPGVEVREAERARRRRARRVDFPAPAGPSMAITMGEQVRRSPVHAERQ